MSRQIDEALQNNLTLFITYNNKNLKKENMNNTLRNRVQLIGNLGAAPEIKIFDGNKKVAKLSIATTEKYKNPKGEWVSDTTWHYLTAWGNQAEFAEKFLVKGSEIAVDGKLKNSTYTDKEGVKRTSTDIQVNEFMMLGKKNS